MRLPAEYAAAHLELGYATTVHRAQGMTVDTAHVLVDASMCRESLYVAMSRGRTGNHAYVVTDEMLDVDLHHQPAPRLDAIGVLTGVLAREGSERSATETIQDGSRGGGVAVHARAAVPGCAHPRHGHPRGGGGGAGWATRCRRSRRWNTKPVRRRAGIGCWSPARDRTRGRRSPRRSAASCSTRPGCMTSPVCWPPG